MKIGALASSLRKPLPATLKKFQEMGLCGVQLLTSPEYLVFSDARLKEIRTMCADHGLEISAVCGDIAHTHFGVTDEWQDRVDLFKKVVDVANKLGTKVITTHIGVVPDDTADPVFDIMVESIGKSAEYSAANDAVFAIETGPESAETLLKLLEAVNSKGLGINLDPANLRMVSRVDPAHAVNVIGKYIVHTHAKDGINTYPGLAAATYGMRNPDGSLRKFEEKPATFQEVPLGQGQVPWDEYLAALKRAGYDGFLTIERECGEDPEADIRLAMDFLKSKIS